MNKLIKIGASATLLSAVACTAIAQSNVLVSGAFDTGLMSVNHVGNGAQSKVSAVDSIMGVSNLGFAGKEDLGNGLSAIFRLQAGFTPTTGAMSTSGQIFSRNAYVGLDGGFGSVTMGKQWNLNDDWLIGSVFKGGYNSGAVFKFSEFDALSEIYNNTIKYVTPSFNGLQVGAMYAAGENAASVSAGSVSNVAIKYVQGPLLLAASYDSEKAGASTFTGNVYKLTTVGLNYGFGAAHARLGYANSNIGGIGTFSSLGTTVGASKANVVEAGLDYDVTAAFTSSADVLYRRNTTLSNSSKVYRLLETYKLSPRTSLIANIAYLNNSGGAAEAMVNADAGAAGAGVGGGIVNQGQTGVALGIIHAF